MQFYESIDVPENSVVLGKLTRSYLFSKFVLLPHSFRAGILSFSLLLTGVLVLAPLLQFCQYNASKI